MDWSLSEFLNIIEARSQTWCRVDIAPGDAFRIPRTSGVFLYYVTEGAVRISGPARTAIRLEANEYAFLLSNSAHVVRAGGGQAAPEALEFLAREVHVDAPPLIAVGSGKPAARLLCGRLRVRWPAGIDGRAFPAVMGPCDGRGVVDFEKLLELAANGGAAATLTHAANLLLVTSFLRDPTFTSAFKEPILDDPLSQAMQLLEIHPHREWTVGSLARKVGMSRSRFAAEFVARMGITPAKAMTNERMKYAAELLEAGALKVADVGELVGYRSESAFTRRFHLHFGRSPGEVRRSAGGRDA